MRHVLNTLYVTTQGTYIHKDGETVCVSQDQKVLLQIPIHTLEGIVTFGRVGTSPALLGFCAERGLAVSFLSRSGRYLACVRPPSSGNVLLRREQFRVADDDYRRAELARLFVVSKLANARQMLLRSARTTGDEAISKAAHEIGCLGKQLDVSVSIDTARGIEGNAAQIYFNVLNNRIQQDGFQFCSRSRRPPLDAINSLLSFVYTLLAHDCAAAVASAGLDPQVGFLHADRPGRPGLALDLMEEFRATFADRLVLRLINRGMIQSKEFHTSPSGAIFMDDKTRKTVLVAYAERKRETITHPFLDETAEIGMLWHIQAMLLARHLRGDLDSYPIMLWR
ncbi:type I-C CRISPR-associated endonuclease Cas1c [Desulfovibrio inopinatus]|uniref:type I-C CRISPR-associated endonuclease Cas1c n=1 Tax=Desulfovibrio inopinatus TaxID=102109 RepID=UPI00040B3B77|nr:type I-C CRISPR-associated endonuclease Cas1c [Desulfovibrio inopinatus]